MKIYLQMEFDSKEEMLATLGGGAPAQPQKNYTSDSLLSDEHRKSISKGMKAMYARRMAKNKQPTSEKVERLAVLSEKEENMTISDVGKHYTNSAKKSVIINRLKAYGLTEELAEKVLVQMVCMGKLIQITPNTFRRPTAMVGKPKKKRGAATIGEYVKGD